MSRGDQREDISLDDVDWHNFIKTLAEARQKTGWQVHAFGLDAAGLGQLAEEPSRKARPGSPFAPRDDAFGYYFG